jgi:hypothetical protein
MAMAGFFPPGPDSLNPSPFAFQNPFPREVFAQVLIFIGDSFDADQVEKGRGRKPLSSFES